MYTNNGDRFISYPCVRALLILFNLAFWISGLSVIWIAIWMQTDFLNYIKISTAHSNTAPFVVLISGAIIVFVSSLACSCIVKIHSPMLVFYGGFLITALFSLISLSVYIHTYQDELLAGVSNGISKEIRNNDGLHKESREENVLDFVQRNLHCCGNESYLDWPHDLLPESCYKNLSASKSKQNIYEVGCSYKLKNIINENFTTIGVLISAIALFPLFGSILSFGLSMMYQKGGYELII